MAVFLSAPIALGLLTLLSRCLTVSGDNGCGGTAIPEPIGRFRKALFSIIVAIQSAIRSRALSANLRIQPFSRRNGK
jgi:hypothetical protein